MKKYTSVLAIALIAALASSGCGSQTEDNENTNQTITSSYYEYNGKIDKIVEAAWNAKVDRTKGWHVNFWGAPTPNSGCTNTNKLINGPVTNSASWDVLADTGIPLGKPSEHFTPVGSTALCPSYSQDWSGFSHVHFKQTSASGPAGLGIYTHSGQKPNDNTLAFFQPYGSAGDHAGGNQDNIGTFVGYVCGRNWWPLWSHPEWESTWTPDWECPSDEIFHPFSAGGNDYDKLRVAIITDLGLVKFFMSDANQQQIRQQFGVYFSSPETGRFILYMFQAAIAGINSTASTSEVEIGIDPSEDGLVYFSGKVGSPGVTSFGQGYPLWTSRGEKTQPSTWIGQKTFQVEISFNQFLNVLKLTTAKILNMNPASVRPTDIASIFGQNYNNPNEWTINMDIFSQEIYNPYWSSKRAYVGGNMTRLVRTSIND